MDANLLRRIGRTCVLLKPRLDSKVFGNIRRLGIGRKLPTVRGSRAGRLIRLWYNLPQFYSTDTRHTVTRTLSRVVNCPTPVISSTTEFSSSPHNCVVNHPTPITPHTTKVRCPSSSSLLKIMHLNAQSCSNKALELADTITDDNYDIAFLSETWFKEVGDESKTIELTPPGFMLKSLPRKTGSGGGLAILYKESLAKCITIRPDSSTYTTFEMCEFRLSHHSRTLTFIFLYRPPPSKRNKLTTKVFIEEFQDLLDSHIATKDLFVIGDVNLHFDSEKETYVVSLKNALLDRNLDQLINVPTHVKGHTLDWIVTNASELIANLNVLDRGLSDHFVVQFEMRLSKAKRPKKNVTSRKLKAIDIASFKIDVTSSLLQQSNTDVLSNYNSCLKKLLDSHAPLVTRTVSVRPSAPWMTQDIKTAKLIRRRAERTFQKTGLTIHRQIYIVEKNKVNRMIRDAKASHIRQKIETSDSSKELFRITAEMLGGANNERLPSSIPVSELPDSFNRFFIGKIEQIRNDMPSLSSQLDHSPIFQNSPFCEFQCVSEDYVKSTILKMPNKSCDLDPIPTSLLLECLDELVPTITNIVNSSLTSGIVPQQFKHALVRPLLKKSSLDPECLKNYRPVSNLPFLSKLLERIVLAQILSHLEQYCLLEEFQSAYRKCRSTETAVVRVLNDLLHNSDIGHISILSMLDLSAAFDTLDHDIMMARFSATFGLAGIVLKWLGSYLTERTQSVVVSGTESTSLLLKYGVPQGSVLGPVLFTMYTYPLSGVIRPTGILYHFFADDSQLYDSSVPSEVSHLAEKISGTVARVSDWMVENKLKMNEDKTEIIKIGTRNNISKVESTDSLFITNCQVSYVHVVRNLGVFFDSTLSFDSHIRQLCKGLYLQLRRLGLIRPYLTTESTKTLAVAFILSRLDYCNAVLAGIPDDKIAKLQRIQNNAARIVLKKTRRDSATALLRALHWLPVKARIDYKVATLCHQCIYNNEMPLYLSELITPYVPQRALRSMDSTLLVVPRFSLKSYGQRAFSVHGPKVWNSLPIELRQTTCYTTFKKNIKTYLFRTFLD